MHKAEIISKLQNSKEDKEVIDGLNNSLDLNIDQLTSNLFNDAAHLAKNKNSNFINNENNNFKIPSLEEEKENKSEKITIVASLSDFKNKLKPNEYLEYDDFQSGQSNNSIPDLMKMHRNKLKRIQKDNQVTYYKPGQREKYQKVNNSTYIIPGTNKRVNITSQSNHQTPSPSKNIPLEKLSSTHLKSLLKSIESNMKDLSNDSSNPTPAKPKPEESRINDLNFKGNLDRPYNINMGMSDDHDDRRDKYQNNTASIYSSQYNPYTNKRIVNNNINTHDNLLEEVWGHKDQNQNKEGQGNNSNNKQYKPIGLPNVRDYTNVINSNPVLPKGMDFSESLTNINRMNNNSRASPMEGPMDALNALKSLTSNAQNNPLSLSGGSGMSGIASIQPQPEKDEGQMGGGKMAMFGMGGGIGNNQNWNSALKGPMEALNALKGLGIDPKNPEKDLKGGGEIGSIDPASMMNNNSMSQGIPMEQMQGNSMAQMGGMSGMSQMQGNPMAQMGGLSGLNQGNPMDQINQMNGMNQSNPMDQTGGMSQGSQGGGMMAGLMESMNKNSEILGGLTGMLSKLNIKK